MKLPSGKTLCGNRGDARTAKSIRSPVLSRFGVADEGLPAAQVDRACAASRRSALLAFEVRRAFELRRDYAGIVEHQTIAGTQQGGQVAHQSVRQAHHRPTRTASAPHRAGQPAAARSAQAAASKSNRSTRMRAGSICGCRRGRWRRGHIRTCQRSKIRRRNIVGTASTPE